MKPQTDLLALYTQWRRLSELEGHAINEGEWLQVQAQQDLKSRLKDRIVAATESWQTACPDAALWRQEYERQFRPIVAELIQLESRNTNWLTRRQTATRAELARLDGSSRNLKGLRKAYAAPKNSQWCSYS